MKKVLFVSLLFICTFAAKAATNDTAVVYVYKIFDEINSTSWTHTQQAFDDAKQQNAKCIILHLNTYGGAVVYADSIRTKILNSAIPIYAFIDNNAASAGALISIACDSIYMRSGANIGAATVVNQSGEKMPDKYQSYMRSLMRSTAESHGMITTVNGKDSTKRWFRNPAIAEAMVDERVSIEGVIDTGKILTFTTNEAIANGYCEGEADNIKDVAIRAGYDNYIIKEYQPTFFGNLKGFLTNPMLRGLLIMIIIGGIYFEFQTPGIGFPLLASAVAAIVYFSALYIDGLAANWEIILFIIGVLLVALEIFVIPGFGVAGISGIVCIIVGLTFGMLNNDLFDFSGVDTHDLVQAFAVTFVSFVGCIILCVIVGRQLMSSKNGVFSKIMLNAEQNVSQGFIGVVNNDNLVGKIGIADTVLKPGGKVIIDDNLYDAISEDGFIDAGASIKVVSVSGGQVVVQLNS